MTEIHIVYIRIKWCTNFCVFAKVVEIVYDFTLFVKELSQSEQYPRYRWVKLSVALLIQTERCPGQRWVYFIEIIET